MKNGFMAADTKMVDEGGHQLVQVAYPGLPAEEILDAVHRFYDEYYFRPKAAFRILRKAMFDSNDRKRLYKEAKDLSQSACHAPQMGEGQTPRGLRRPRRSPRHRKTV